MKDDKGISTLACLKSIRSIVLRELLLMYYYTYTSIKSLSLIRNVFDVDKQLKCVEEKIDSRTKRRHY